MARQFNSSTRIFGRGFGLSLGIMLVAAVTLLLSSISVYAAAGVVSGRLWNDLDNNQTQNSGEPGLPNVTVNLRFAGTDGILGTADDVFSAQVTDNDGNYAFTGLDAGDYEVAIDYLSGPLLMGFDINTANEPLDITLGLDEIRNNGHFGFVYGGKSSIGNYVWNDLSADGDWVDEGAEFAAGLPGVSLSLYLELDGNGAFSPGLGGDLLALTTSTDGTGKYSFPTTANGNEFWVRVDPSNFLPGGALAGYIFTNGNGSAYDPDNPIFVPLTQFVQSYTLADFGFVLPADLQVVKRDSPDPVQSGNALTYTLGVTNHGPATAVNVVVTDTLPGAVSFVSSTPDAPTCTQSGGALTCNLGDLSASVTTTVTVRVTVAPGAVGQIVNRASVSSDTYDTVPGNNQDTEPTSVLNPAIDVQKSASPTVILANAPVVYTFLVTNPGDVSLATVQMIDNTCSPVIFSSGDTNGNSRLDPGETWRYTCTTPVAIDTTNIITATAQPSDSSGAPLPQFPPVSDTDTADVNVVAPAIKIVKDVNLPVMYVGETAKYTLTVTNPGDVPLGSVGVTDNTCAPVVFGGGDTNGNDLLETTESWIYHCQKPLSATITNTATASGQPSTPGGTPLPGISPVTDQDQATVKVIDPKIRIVKTPSATVINPGDPVTYTYAVTNPGNDPLGAVSVGDNKCAPVTFGSGDTNANNLLDLNETWTFSCQANLTQDTTNLATATATDSLGNPVNNTATAFVDVVIVGLQIDKTASAATVYAGTPVTYTYTVQNTGSDTVNSVVVVDNQCNTVTFLGGDTASDDLLAPGEVWTYQCVEPLTVDTVNVVQVTGKDELGNPLEEQAQATVDVINPAIHVVKSADRTTILAGDAVVYTFLVTNPGDDPLASVTLGDDKCSPVTGPSGDNGNSLLDPGEVWGYACTATAVLTDTVNIVTVGGVDSLGNPVGDQDTAVVDVVAPAIDVVKVATPKVILSGDLVAYDFLVSNQGDVALANIALSDDKCAPITGPNPAGDVNSNGLLDVDETWTYACVTSVAVDTTNVVNVSGQPSDPAGTPFPGIGPVTDTGSANVDVVAPAINLVKEVSRPAIYVGESVIYTFTVTNPGDVTLRTVNLTDDKCAPLTFVGGDANNNGRLETSETWIYTCQTPLSTDTVNTAHVSGRPSDSTGALYPNLPPVSDSDTAAVNVLKPVIQIVKTADVTLINPGETVVYTFDVTNTGDDPLANVAVSDNKCSPLTGPNPAGDVNSNGKLDPTETWRYSCTTTLSADTTNTATATGDDSLGNPVSDTDTAHVNVVIAGIQVDKSASAPIVYAGDLVTYTYSVRNTGTDPITTVLVDDNMCAPAAYRSGDTNSNAILNPGEIWLYTCATTLSQDTVNKVTATGKDPLNQPVMDDATASVNVINPAINVVKSVDRTVILSGTLVEYTFIVTNPGDDPLTDVVLGDNQCSPLVRQSGDVNSNSILEPGEVWVYTCKTSLTVDTVNVVSAGAKDSLGNPVGDTDSKSVDVVAPKIDVAKSADRTVILAGDVVRYTFLVSNLGDVPLASVNVSDNKCSPISNPDPTGDANSNGRLDPGEVWAYSCTTAVNTDTLNTVTVNGQPTDPNGVPLPGINPVSDQDTESVTVVEPAIHIEKTVTPTVIYANEGVVYSFTVTNPGDTPLRDVVVNDNQCAPLSFLGGDSNSNGRLDVGESWRYSCTANPGADVLNTASVVGRPSAADGSLLPGFSPVNDTDTAEVNVITPGITVVKTASEIAVAPGTPVTYTYAVSNSGDDPLTNVAVSDNTCSPASRVTVDANGLLDPGESWTFRCSAILTKDTTNIATATANDSLGNPVSDDDTEFVEVVQAAIDLVKVVDRSVIYAGETVTFSLDVVNIGNDPIMNVVLTDNKCTSLTGPTGDLNNDSILNVTETWRYTCTQPLSVDTTNTAVVTAKDGLGQPLTDDDAAAVNVINPKIAVVKSANRTVILPNGQVQYSYRVTNPGDDALKSVAVSDDKCAPLVFVSGDGNGSGRLEPGEAWLYTCTTTLSVTTLNTVTATALDSLSKPVSDTDTATVTVVNPAINVVKSADPVFVLAGQVVQYTYLVTNPGDVALANISLADDTCPSPSYQGGDANTSGLLEPGETWTYRCSTGVAADITNTVTASGQPSDPTGVFLPGMDPVQDQDTAFVDRVAPAVLLAKAASASQVYSGATVVYTYTATNPGDVTLSAVKLTDDKCAPAAFVSGDNGNNLLDPGESWVYTCAASLTQDTLNTATVSGQPSAPGGLSLPGVDPVDDTATAFVDVITPGLTLTKRASEAQVLPGTPVVYTFQANNTGNTPLANVTVTDDKCAPASRVSVDSNNLLDPGESWTFRCTSTLTQDTTNIATATATDPLGGPVQDDDTAFVNVIIAGLRVTKVASAATVYANGPVTYTYQAVNTGTDPVHNVTVSDNKCAPVSFISGDDGDNLLESGETWLYRCVANLAVDTTNIVTLGGEDSLGNPVDPDQASRAVNVINPAINVAKSVDKSVIVSGSTVIYTYLVTNPGDDPLATVTVSDDKCSPLLFSGGDANSNGRLDPGENWRYTCSTALSADTVNIVTAGGTDSLGNRVTDTDTASVDVLHPAINVVKSASPMVLTAGQSVVYTFTVTNPGDAPLATVRVSDNTCAPTVYRSGDANSDSRLDPGESWIYTCARTVNQDTTNVVTVSGQPTDPSGTPAPGAAPVGDTDSLSVDVVAPALVMDKRVNAATVYANGQVTYTYVITNTGDTPLVNLTVTDDKLGTICTLPGPLAVGASQTCTSTTALTADTLNVGTVSGQPSDSGGNPLPGIPPVTATDTAQVDVIAPAIRLAKSASTVQVLPGTLVTFTLVATNIGDAPLANVAVSDPQCGTITRISTDGNGLLDPGESWTYRCAAAIARDTVNTATVTAQDTLGGPVTDTATATVTVINPGIRITKSASPTVVVAGGQVTFTMLVENLGSNPVANVVVTDNQCIVTFVGGDANSNSLLDTAETWSYRCVRSVSQDTVNTATVSGQPSDPQGNPLPGIPPVTDTGTATVDVVAPAIQLTKTASPAQVVSGAVVTFTLVATNTGDTPIANVVVSDPQCGSVTRITVDSNGLLDPGESWTFHCTATITQDTVNTATVNGQPSDPQGNPLPGVPPVTDAGTATVDAINPAIDIVKTASVTQAVVGQVVTYTYQVRNTGDVSLTGVSVVDDRCAGVFRISTDLNGLLDPGEVWTYSCVQTIRATDPTPLVNVADVTATDPTGGTVTDQATATVNIVTPPKLVATKAASLAIAKPGDTLTYRIIITNTGGSAATGVIMNDTPDGNTTLVVGSVSAAPVGTAVLGNSPGNSSVRVSIGTLAPGASVTITFDVTINDPFLGPLDQVQNQGVIGSNELPDLPTDDPTTVIDGDVTITPIETALPALKASKRVSGTDDQDLSNSITPGDVIHYEIVLTNEGLGTATDVFFLDSPDSNTALVVGSVVVSQGSVQNGNTAGDTSVAVTIPSMKAGDIVVIAFDVTIDDPLPAGVIQVVNQGVVQSNETNPQVTDDPTLPGDADPTVTDVVVTMPELRVVKRNTLFTDADSSGGLSPGDSMQYEIVITNNSGTLATDVVFSDTPDINTTLIVGTVTTSRGTVILGNSPGNTTVRVNVGTLPGGQAVTIRLWVRINLNLPSGVFEIVNQGLVSSLELPDLPTDDPATGGQGDPTQVPIQRIFKLYMPMLLNQPPAVVTPTPTPSPTPSPTPTPETGADNFVGDPIDGLIHPKGMAVHQGQNMLFIVSRDNDQLLKVNPLGNTVVATAATGDEPWGVVVNEATNRVYVSNYASADVWVYDANTLALITKIRLGNPGEVQPALMEILPAIDTVAVVVRSNGGGGSVAIIEGLTLQQTIGATGVGTYGIAVDRVRNRVIVSNRDGGNVRVLYRTEFGQWMNDGQNFTASDRRVPFEVEYNPTNQKLYILYVINMDWYVDIWEVRANDWFWKVGTVSVGKSGGAKDPNVGGTGLAVDTATGNVFVANSKDNTVSVISGSSNQVITTLATGADPFHITVNPITRMVYVSLRNAHRLVNFLDRY